MKTLVMGIVLFFLAAGFNEESFSVKQSFIQNPFRMIAFRKGIAEKRRNGVLPEPTDTSFNRIGKSVVRLDLVPDAVVKLATGKHIQLQQLIDQQKYIFINIWSGKKREGVKDVKLIDSIADVYKTKLIAVGLLDEGNLIQLKRLIRKHQLKNVQGLVSADFKKYLPLNAYPYGILFSKTGKLIETGMNWEALEMYMKKHVTLSRAKF